MVFREEKKNNRKRLEKENVVNQTVINTYTDKTEHTYGHNHTVTFHYMQVSDLTRMRSK